MTAITLIVTDAGLALLPANGGVSAVTLSHYGISQTAFAASAASTAIPNELKRLTTLSGAPTGTGTITLSLMDDSEDVYDMRAVGIYASDGTLFAVYSQAEPITSKAAGSNVMTTVDVTFARVNVDELIFGDSNFLLPSATTEREGLVELATSAETNTGTDTIRAVTPKGMRDTLTSPYVIARIGYTPLNQAYYTASDVLAKILTVDGAGSGLDTDRFHGQPPSYYTDIPSRLGYTPANKAGDVFTGIIARDGFYYLEIVGGDPVLNFDVSDYLHYQRAANSLAFHSGGSQQWVARADGNFHVRSGLTAAGNIVWHGGNDGAGSGLDTDLFRGLAPSYFTDIVGRLGYVPANKAGDTFTGRIARDVHFYIDVAAGINPITNYDFNDYLLYNRASDNLSFWLGGTLQWNIGADGMFHVRSGLTAAGHIAYHAGNDGAGSGLDADLWRGQTPLNTVLTGLTTVTEIEASTTVWLKDRTQPTTRYAWYGVDGVARFWSGTGDSVTIDSATATWNFTHAPKAAGNSVFHAGNDGAGSGLDTDLFRGLPPSYFTDIVSRLGYAPVNKAGDTLAGPLNATHLTAASGYVVGSNAFAVLSAGSGTGRGAAVFLRPDGSDSALNEVVVGTNLTYAGNIVYHSGNDGSGSGVDADMLDGRHANEFPLLSDFADMALTTPRGHFMLPNGLVVCWGTSGSLGNDASQTLALTKTMSRLLAVVSSANGATANDDNWGITVNPPIGGACSSITVGRGSKGDGVSGTVTFIALGLAA